MSGVAIPRALQRRVRAFALRDVILLTLAATASLAAQNAAETRLPRADSAARNARARDDLGGPRLRRRADLAEDASRSRHRSRATSGRTCRSLLQGAAPSLTSYAETGNYWGYSYIRLRGIDQSRINLTLDGIPLNDPEDQVLYFADFPDLANSLQSVQVQRGVGTSSNGTAAYAGSINMETMPLAAAPRGRQTPARGRLVRLAAREREYQHRTAAEPSRVLRTRLGVCRRTDTAITPASKGASAF